MGLILQLINGISRALQKLLKYFNGTIISRSFVPLPTIWPVIFCLNLNESVLSGKLSIAPTPVKVGSSLIYHKLQDVFNELSLYFIKLYIGITTSTFLALSICVLYISLMQSVNKEKKLNITFLLLLPGSAAAANVAAVIVPFASIYASI